MKISYADTTIKLDAMVVQEVASVLPEKQTLTAFVREAVTRDVRRRKLKQAASLYQAMLGRDSDEAGAMEEWESSPLATEPKRTSSRKS
jgi:hypothetical protein